MNRLNILVLDDEKRLREEIVEYLSKRSYSTHQAASPSEAFQILTKHEVDIAIVDIRLPEMSGLEVLRQIREEYPQIEALMISGHGDMQSVIEALREGAVDYFQKPFKLSELHHAIQRTKRFIELSRQLQKTQNRVQLLSEKLYSVKGTHMLGTSKEIQKVGELMERLAKTDSTSVLITGESGTGKELVAHGIHLLSSRSKQLFHSVNCSAITDSLFESEFFGHRKGAFTGADQDRAGWFEAASGGTLFLDEIGDMPLTQQAKLLRTLEERTVRKVGGIENIHVDVRVIAASNQDLKKMVQTKKFRADLYHRLTTFIIHIPPLRERKEDIELLMNYFLQQFSDKMNKDIRSIDEKVIQKLSSYSFPGNIRELRNILERAIILCDDDILHLEHFPGFAETESKSEDPSNILNNKLEDIEKMAISYRLKQTEGNKAKAAEALGITWQSLDRRIKKLQIERHENE